MNATQNQSLNILVTGATGKVGSRLVPRLVKWGYNVRALVRDASCASFLTSCGAELTVGDLLNPESFKAAVKDIDAVVHLATFYRGAIEEQVRAANIEGTAMLGKAALDAGVKSFVFISTNRIYGSGRGKLITESDPIRPLNKFAVLKAEAENLLAKAFETSNSALCILRFPLIYGDGDPHIGETLPELHDWAPAKRVQMVHHADIAQAIRLSISLKANGIYNVTDDAPLTISELRRLHHIPDTPDAPVADPWEMIVSNMKIREGLGFRPVYPTFYSARDAGAL